MKLDQLRGGRDSGEGCKENYGEYVAINASHWTELWKWLGDRALQKAAYNRQVALPGQGECRVNWGAYYLTEPYSRNKCRYAKRFTWQNPFNAVAYLSAAAYPNVLA
jgi:hypothetical protein